MSTKQADLVPVNPRIMDNSVNDAVVGSGLLCFRKLTVPEAAKAMSIGETKMREILKRGDIPVIRIMDKMLILERDLEAFLQGHYGSLRMVEQKPKGLPSLPKHIRESRLLKRAS